jgi:hypothetical protein
MSAEATATEVQAASIDVEEPILNTALPKELSDKFDGIFTQVYELFIFAVDSDEEDEDEAEEEGEEDETEDEMINRHQRQREILESRGAALCQRIEEEVSAHPILAKTVDSNMLLWSLLTVVCEKTYATTLGHAAIKFLIETNPHSLLWRWGDRYSQQDAIHSIAKNSCHCVLLPWIAEQYPWVLEHKRCKNAPPHLELAKKHADGECAASVVRRFYELFPQGLLQQSRVSAVAGFPLQCLLIGWEECDADLFIWMAQQAPAAVKHKGNWGTNVLHSACMSLSSSPDPDLVEPIDRCTENNARICRFLVSEHPQLVRSKGRGGRGLPIHHLAHRCNRMLVQEVLLLLLKEFPESIEVKAAGYLPKLSNVPFIQQVAPLVKQESGLQQEQEWLLPATANFLAYTGSLDHPSIDVNIAKLEEAFENWVKERNSEVESLQEQIGEIRLAFQGDDVVATGSDDEEEDDEEDDEEEVWISEDDGSENEEDDESEDSSDDDSLWY